MKTKLHSLINGLAVLLGGLALLALTLPAAAATRTWTGAGANGFWTNAANWNGGLTVPVNGDGLIFPAGAARLANTNAVGGPSNLVFLAFTGSNYTLVSPISLALTNGLTNAPAINQSNTVRANLELRANQTWSLADKTVLTLASNVALGTFRLTLADGGSVDISGNVTGSGAAQLLKDNVGRLSLSGPANSIPDCRVRDGTLTVEGTLSGSLSVSNGAVLSGSGTVPPFVCAGTVRPGGSSVGVLTVSGGTAAFQAGSTFQVNLNGPAPGTDYDQLRVSAPPSLSGATLSVLPGFSPIVGQSFVVITNTGAAAFTTTFTNLPEGSILTVSNLRLRVSYAGGDGNDVTLTAEGYNPSGVTRTWSGAGANGLWTNPTNWVGNTTPAQGDNLLFPPGAARANNTNDFPAGTTFHAITVSSNNYSLHGNSLRLNSGVQGVFASGSSTCNVPVVLAQAQTFSCLLYTS
ncbi:MAG: hypothetical protein N3I86_15975, partial [Verrucomicrobiae bacterium]|nr:hypothetical protein [Verrucomicrobiae bacterium]